MAGPGEQNDNRIDTPRDSIRAGQDSLNARPVVRQENIANTATERMGNVGLNAQNAAREKFGLPPLSPEDYSKQQGGSGGETLNASGNQPAENPKATEISNLLRTLAAAPNQTNASQVLVRLQAFFRANPQLFTTVQLEPQVANKLGLKTYTTTAELKKRFA